MLEYAVWQWEHNKKELLEALREVNVDECRYAHLMELVVRHILNGKERYPRAYSHDWNENDIIEMGDGYYNGDLIYVIHTVPLCGIEEYLATYIEYGSCSLCDTLQGIACEPDREQQICELLQVCLDMVTRLKPMFDHYGVWKEATVDGR